MVARWAWLVVLWAGCGAAQPVVSPPQVLDATSARVFAAALQDGGAWQKLVELCDDVGHRLSGSPQLDLAIAWAQRAMQKDHLTGVRAEPVQVPVWRRGEESLEVLAPRALTMNLLGLGGSIATPPEGIEAAVVVVSSRADLERRGPQLHGKIAVLNQPMPQWSEASGTGYAEAVQARVYGAQWAAQQGAVAVLVRSVTATNLGAPHTGGMRYGDALVKIPSAAISVESAELLARWQQRGITAKVKLRMAASTHPDAPSANVVAEIRGRELPNEIVVIGGHLDSWDVGQGAHDDGAGCAMAMQAAAVIQRLGLVPRRTIRVVLWTNEENGLAGARAYAAGHVAERHIAALESDGGAFEPEAIGLAHSDASVQAAAAFKLAQLLGKIPGNLTVRPGRAAADVAPLGKQGALTLSLLVRQDRYFDYHHSAADTVDKVDPALLAKGAATMAALAWLLAEGDDLAAKP